jgi:DNA-binding NarL/FixJ family response regulator
MTRIRRVLEAFVSGCIVWVERRSCVAARTVANQMASILRKLGVGSRTELAALA